MKPSTTARRYAEAAFEVAREAGDLQSWLKDLQQAAATLRDQQVTLFFKDPAVGNREKLETAQQLFGDLNPHVFNLLRLLMANHRLSLVPQIAREYEDLYRKAEGIMEAQVTVARPLTEKETADIKRRLSQVTGKKIELEALVDPAILGGIIVRVGDRLIDASVAGRLQRLRQEMAV